MTRPLLGLILSLCCIGGVRAQGTLLDANAEFTRDITAWDASLEAHFKGVSNPLDTDHLNQVGWAYRVLGDTRETFLPTPDTQTYGLEPESQMQWLDLDNRGLLSVREHVTLSGNDPTFNEPLDGQVTMTLELTNIDTAAVTIDVFHILDLNIAGSASDDTAALVLPVSEPTIRFTDANGLIGYYSGSDVDAFAVRTRGFDDLHAMLADADVDDFDGGGLPAEADDLMAGFEWMNRTLQPGETLTVAARFSINRPTVEGDLQVSLSATPDPVLRGELLTLAATVLNAGATPSPATTLTFDLAADDLTIVGTQGCTNDPMGFPQCTLGTLQPGDDADVVLQVSPGVDTGAQIAAQVRAGSPDASELTPADNLANANVAVISPVVDLRVTKGNDVDDVAVDIDGWQWILVAGNSVVASQPAQFQAGEIVVVDQVPASAVAYGPPSSTLSAGVTGTALCTLAGFDLRCTATSPLEIAPGASIRVALPVLPLALGSYTNPRSDGVCMVDPGDAVTETSENNNSCSDSVSVVDHLLFTDGFEN